MVLSYTPNKEVAGTPQFSQLAQESDPTVQGIIQHNSRLFSFFRGGRRGGGGGGAKGMEGVGGRLSPI